MNQINREHFEAWLFSQPDERVFDYRQGFKDEQPGCLICNFLRENTNLNDFSVGGKYFRFNGIIFNFEKWLYTLLSSRGPENVFTAGLMKQSYLTQFPNAEVGNVHVALVSSAKESKTILAQS